MYDESDGRETTNPDQLFWMTAKPSINLPETNIQMKALKLEKMTPTSIT